MAFSIRKMLSNIHYFKKLDESADSNDGNLSDSAMKRRRHTCMPSEEPSKCIKVENTEPDSTSKQCSTSLKLPDSVKSFAAKKGSLSDTDILTINIETPSLKKDRRKCKKLKLDIKTANKSNSECTVDDDSSNNVENTPKHILLDGERLDVFSERFKGLDFNKSFDIFDAMSDESSPYEEEDLDIESLSDTDISITSADGKTEIKMCRKVEEDGSQSSNDNNQLVPSTSPESFGDVELDRNEEERVTLLLNYQMKLEKIECLLKKLLTEFQFHIEVSKIFNCRSLVTALPGEDHNIPKLHGEVTYMDNISRGVSPTGSWNIIMEKEDKLTKFKVRKQLLSLKQCIEEFLNIHLQNRDTDEKDKTKKLLSRERKSITFDLHKGKRVPQKRLRISHKKKHKHFDFPDLREVMMNLFTLDTEREDNSISANNVTSLLSDLEESDISKCNCRCHYHRSPSSQTDSGLTTKTNDRSMSNQSITSSIGNFSLDSTTLTAYSESLDQIISYNSFQDTSLYSTLLQKAAIERITFYVQVHSIQLKCEQTEQEYESKNMITFLCPSCKITENEENGLLRHILSQSHCEKIHFLYKTAYIKKCVSSGKEIQPSTVLNPMTMYRDENKIVCFGDAMYACSLCFENLIIGESVLMAHCMEPEHVERREKLCEILD